MIPVGRRAPDFELSDDRGQSFRLASAASTWTVLYFYRGEGRVLCRRMANTFRDLHTEFHDRDAAVVGVSRDSIEENRRFKQECDLPYQLLSDPDAAVHQAYGSIGRLGFARRMTYVLDQNLMVRHVFERQWSPVTHGNDALDFLQSYEPRSTTVARALQPEPVDRR